MHAFGLHWIIGVKFVCRALSRWEIVACSVKPSLRPQCASNKRCTMCCPTISEGKKVHACSERCKKPCVFCLSLYSQHDLYRWQQCPLKSTHGVAFSCSREKWWAVVEFRIKMRAWKRISNPTYLHTSTHLASRCVGSGVTWLSVSGSLIIRQALWSILNPWSSFKFCQKPFERVNVWVPASPWMKYSRPLSGLLDL